MDGSAMEGAGMYGDTPQENQSMDAARVFRDKAYDDRRTRLDWNEFIGRIGKRYPPAVDLGCIPFKTIIMVLQKD